MRGSRRQSSGSAEAALPGGFIACPIRTPSAELEGEKEIKAYKLGKKRWSYNQCALTVKENGGSQSMDVVDCMQYGQPTLSNLELESGVTYQVRLKNGYRVKINIFVVYNHPRQVEVQDDDGNSTTMWEWPSISRSHCPKEHCEGPILRTIQRFGKLGRRSGRNNADGNCNENAMKDAKYMFVSIDEAGSHVKVKHFRLVAGMYETGGDVLLGTAISGPIRVLANNDVPTGAAYIPLVLTANSSWEGWNSNSEARMHPGVERVERELTFATAIPLHRDGSRSLSSNETDYNLATEGRFLGNADKPTLNLLKEHAVNYSQDTDNGATRFSEHYKKVNGIDCATSPAQQLRPPRFLAAEEEAHPFGAMTPMGGRARLTADLHFGNLQSNDYSPALSIASARGHISPQLQSNLGFLPEQHEGHFLHPMDGLYPIAFNQFSSNPHPGPRFTDGGEANMHTADWIHPDLVEGDMMMAEH